MSLSGEFSEFHVYASSPAQQIVVVVVVFDVKFVHDTFREGADEWAVGAIGDLDKLNGGVLAPELSLYQPVDCWAAAHLRFRLTGARGAISGDCGVLLEGDDDHDDDVVEEKSAVAFRRLAGTNDNTQLPIQFKQI